MPRWPWLSRIGALLVQALRLGGHSGRHAQRAHDGEGLAEVLTGAANMVDVSNSPSPRVSRQEVLPGGDAELLAAKRAAREELVADSQIPYSIVQATQFFEFVNGIADEATHGDTVRIGTGVHPADGRGPMSPRPWRSPP